jgi:hypothetical protein
VLDLTVRDGFADAEEVAQALAAWPADGWHSYGEHKRATVPGAPMPGPIGRLLFNMAHERMTAYPLAYLPDLGLWGAGLHEMPAGAAGLGWHTDAERHAVLGLRRVKSGVLYLCGDGDLEFRDGARVSPAPGRLVLFDGSAPHRVGPVTRLRRSVTMFWYGHHESIGASRAVFEDAK